MCRLLGIRNYRHSEHREVLESFSGLAETGKVLPGSAPGHRDGWGIGFYEDGRAMAHKSAACLTAEKAVLDEWAARADGSPCLIVHLRKAAWPDSTKPEHSHPFRGDNCLFAHNGTIRDFKKLFSDKDFMGFVKGKLDVNKALDSEVFFQFILSRLHLGAKEALLESFRLVSANLSYSSLNCLFADGESLFAYRDCTRDPGYYSLYRAGSGASTLVCSEPVSPRYDWNMIPRRELAII